MICNVFAKIVYKNNTISGKYCLKKRGFNFKSAIKWVKRSGRDNKI